MNLVSMETPYTREEFENRIHRLHHSIVKGNMHFSSGLPRMSMEELANMRLMPNGRMDLLTIDESARLTANMMVQLDGMLDEG